MVLEACEQDPGDATLFGRNARQLGIGDHSLRSWVNQTDIDQGTRVGLCSARPPILARVDPIQSSAGST
jgi:transposase-like protein